MYRESNHLLHYCILGKYPGNSIRLTSLWYIVKMEMVRQAIRCMRLQECFVSEIINCMPRKTSDWKPDDVTNVFWQESPSVGHENIGPVVNIHLRHTRTHTPAILLRESLSRCRLVPCQSQSVAWDVLRRTRPICFQSSLSLVPSKPLFKALLVAEEKGSGSRWVKVSRE